jgi:hypothetical protein
MNHDSVPVSNQTPYFSIGSNVPVQAQQNSVTVYSEHEMNTLFEEPYVDEPETYQSGEQYQSSIHIENEDPQTMFTME